MRGGLAGGVGQAAGPGPTAFLANLETEVLRLERELRSGTWWPGGYVLFEIRDPKRRDDLGRAFRRPGGAPRRARGDRASVRARLHPPHLRQPGGEGDLAHRLDGGRVPPDEALAITTLLADALTALHEAGYVHGDVKPSNRFVVGGTPKLLDFGLARASADADAAGGTLRYPSPEVLAGRPADEADDVWSLCVVLHEMVTGEHLFPGGDAGEVADRIRRQRPARPAGGRRRVADGRDGVDGGDAGGSPVGAAGDGARARRGASQPSARAVRRDVRFSIHRRLEHMEARCRRTRKPKARTP